MAADMRGGGEDDVVDLLRRQRIVAAQQLADELDGHIIGRGSPEDPFRPGAPEGAADAVDEVDLAELAHRAKASRLPGPRRRSDRHGFGAITSPTRALNLDTLEPGRRLAVPNQGTSTGEDWLAHVDREEARYRDGESRLPNAGGADASPRRRTPAPPVASCPGSEGPRRERASPYGWPAVGTKPPPASPAPPSAT